MTRISAFTGIGGTGGGGSGGSGPAFGIIQPPNGTSPTATTTSDTLNFTSSDSSVTVTGTAGTKTVDFKAPIGASVPIGILSGGTGATIALTAITNLFSGPLPIGVSYGGTGFTTIAPLWTYPTTGSAVGGANGTTPSSMTGVNNILIGGSAGSSLSTGNNNVFIGASAGVIAQSGINNVCIGSGVLPNVAIKTGNVVIGAAAGPQNANVINSVIIGNAAVGGSGAICLGANAANTLANQFVAGSVGTPMTNVFFGQGVGTSLPLDWTLNGNAGLGTNTAGGNLILAGGNATGTATAGSIIFKTGLARATGTSAQVLTTALSVSPLGSLNSSAPQTVLNGSAGTATCSMPYQGSSYKKVVVYLSGYTDTGTQVYTYPTAFLQVPYAYGLASIVSGTAGSTTSVTFTTTTLSGFLFLEGY